MSTSRGAEPLLNLRQWALHYNPGAANLGLPMNETVSRRSFVRLAMQVGDMPKVPAGAMSSTAFDNLTSFSQTHHLGHAMFAKEVLLDLKRDIDDYIERELGPAVDEILATQALERQTLTLLSPGWNSHNGAGTLPASAFQLSGGEAKPFPLVSWETLAADEVHALVAPGKGHVFTVPLENFVVVESESAIATVRRCRELISEIKKFTNRTLATLNAIVATTFRLFRTPRFQRQLLAIQTPWHLLHGTHPPELLAKNCLALSSLWLH